MDGNRISYHESVRTMYERLKGDGMSGIGTSSRGSGATPIAGARSARPERDATSARTAPAGPTPPVKSGGSTWEEAIAGYVDVARKLGKPIPVEVSVPLNTSNAGT
ncbi:hypothetical protein ASZ90_011258 [hydrocarbon metagenome]|uniref:Uncharacterized protein n=1 Tax=hydrocarbon metagenome TaxID=938273 RepID=A0A0W8FDP9_9ZZZZ